jgi:carbon-monoxide dehydrogenase small subunit
MSTQVNFVLNGAEVSATVRGGSLLLDLLRGPLEHKGTKEGCGKGECGACSVLVDGRVVNACLYPAAELGGRSVTTIEGLSAQGGGLDPVQQAFVDEGGIQCGFCSPGMILAARALLDRNTDPSDEEIRNALVGNLCRCTGYVQIVDSVKRAVAARETEGASRG